MNKLRKNCKSRRNGSPIFLSLFFSLLMLLSSQPSMADLSDDDNVLLDHETGNNTNLAETTDLFGSALTVGNFDDTGGVDLAVGVPGKNGRAGVVQIFRSFESITSPDRGFLSGIWEVLRSPGHPNDYFGSCLARGDFNDDGVDDLAVGAPRSDSHLDPTYTPIVYDVRLVRVCEGREGSGITHSPEYRTYRQGMEKVGDNYEVNDQFGSVLAAGDFNNDGYADLTIGVPSENYGTIKDAGQVHVLYGSEKGLTEGRMRTQIWSQTPRNPVPVVVYPWWVNDKPIYLFIEDEIIDSGDQFGYALAVGYFNNDPYADLAIGVPGESITGRSGSIIARAGAVHVLYGSETG